VTLGFENKEGDESEQDRNHATRGYGHGPRKLRLPRCFHNFEQGQRRVLSGQRLIGHGHAESKSPRTDKEQKGGPRCD